MLVAVVALLLLALIVVVLLVGRGGRDASRRPDPERYLAVHGLPPSAAGHLLADRVLWRTRWFRILGAWCGFFACVAWRLWRGSGGLIAGLPELTCALAGSLVGVAVAETRRPRRGDGTRVASLVPRELADYADARQQGGRVVLVGVVAALAVLTAVADSRPLPRLAALALALAGLGCEALTRLLQRRVVERTQPPAPAEVLAVDDALRASGVRALHHAAAGLLWCAVLGGVVLVGMGADRRIVSGDTVVATIEPSRSFGAVSDYRVQAGRDTITVTLDRGMPSERLLVHPMVERGAGFDVEWGPGPGQWAALGWSLVAVFALGAAVGQWRMVRRSAFDDRVRPTVRAVATGAAS